MYIKTTKEQVIVLLACFSLVGCFVMRSSHTLLATLKKGVVFVSLPVAGDPDN